MSVVAVFDVVVVIVVVFDDDANDDGVVAACFSFGYLEVLN